MSVYINEYGDNVTFDSNARTVTYDGKLVLSVSGAQSGWLDVSYKSYLSAYQSNYNFAPTHYVDSVLYGLVYSNNDGYSLVDIYYENMPISACGEDGAEVECSSMTYSMYKEFSHYFNYVVSVAIDGIWYDLEKSIPKYLYHINICKGSTLYYTTSVGESDYNSIYAQGLLDSKIYDCIAGLKIKTDCCILVCCEPDKYELI